MTAQSQIVQSQKIVIDLIDDSTHTDSSLTRVEIPRPARNTSCLPSVDPPGLLLVNLKFQRLSVWLVVHGSGKPYLALLFFSWHRGRERHMPNNPSPRSPETTAMQSPKGRPHGVSSLGKPETRHRNFYSPEPATAGTDHRLRNKSLP